MKIRLHVNYNIYIVKCQQKMTFFLHKKAGAKNEEIGDIIQCKKRGNGPPDSHYRGVFDNALFNSQALVKISLSFAGGKVFGQLSAPEQRHNSAAEEPEQLIKPGKGP